MAATKKQAPLNDEDLKMILRCGVPGSFWPHDTVTLCIVRTKDGRVLSRKSYKCSGGDASAHTEMQFLADMENSAELDTHFREILLSGNYSPCAGCADKLCQWIEKHHSNVSLTIQFAHLYNVYVHHDAKENAQGLRKMREGGIKLRALSAYDWLQFLLLDRGFAAKDDWIAKRKQADETNSSMLKEVLDSTGDGLELDETLKKLQRLS